MGLRQDAEDELIDESMKLDNDEKEILASEEVIKQLGRDAGEIFDAVNMSGKGWTEADEDPPDEVFGGEAGLEFLKTDVEMVDIPSLQFTHIRGGSLDEVTELLSGNPDDDLNTLARDIGLIDDALEMTRMEVWVWFQLVGGGCSCQLLIGRRSSSAWIATSPGLSPGPR